jgi:uncharacterized protein YdeI (BOF family)
VEIGRELDVILKNSLITVRSWFKTDEESSLDGETERMRSLKIISIAAVLFLMLGAVVFVYANSQNMFRASDDGQSLNLQNLQAFFASENGTMRCRMGWGPRAQANNLESVLKLFENATTSTVQGTIVSQIRGILILNTDSGQVRIMIPNGWTVGSEVVGRATLFNGTFSGSGQSVTVNVLKSDLISNSNLSINVMLGYEVVNASGTHAYAVLPFNIQAGS